MWQLNLLGDVLPVFVAFARQQEKECGQGQGTRADVSHQLFQQAVACRNNLNMIDDAVARSRGEWTRGLDEKVINRLLETLNSRVQLRSRLPRVPFLSTAESSDNYSKLRALSKCMHSLDEDCTDDEDQESCLYQIYRSALERANLHVHLLPLKESHDNRTKFITRIYDARRHLLNQYYKDHRPGDPEVELSQHPSFGIKELAKTAYDLLERHSRCKCRPPEARREIRLSLTEHRLFQLQHSPPETVISCPCSADFKVLLPECQAYDDWKIANIHVQSSKAKGPKTHRHLGQDKELINKDICQIIQRSKTTCIHLLASQGKLWVLRPPPPLGNSRHTAMQSLRELLGSGQAHVSGDITRYGQREKLLLSYILATSLLYLYPSEWMMLHWSSDKIYFPRTSGRLESFPFALPYLSISLQQNRGPPNSPPVSHYHQHPTILALGIMLLEIATGVQFNPTYDSETIEVDQSDRYNEYGRQALSILNELERRGERHPSQDIPPVLSSVIRSCLIINKPPTMAAERMSEEGPIRYYILCYIVSPLATELCEGYRISLDKLHDVLQPEPTPESYSKMAEGSGSPMMTSVAEIPTPDLHRFDLPLTPVSSHEPDSCLYGGKEELVDKSKLRSSDEWFSWLCSMQHRIKHLQRNPRQKKVKVAILDTGLHLSEDQAEIYNRRRDLVYRSWIDKHDESWKDEVGHGTHLATLLSRTAPQAQIHVARVFQKAKPDLRCEPQKVASAIRHAVDIWEVDIIAMAFGFEDEQTSPNEEESLFHSIQYAAKSGVIMFAAASNDGKNRMNGIAWPARASEVICVHSGDGHGTRSTFTPNPCDNQRIMLLGEHVKSAWPKKSQHSEDSKLMSGTSCATSIAAGVAALLLHYARGFLDETQWKRLKRVESMRSLFWRLRDDRGNDGYHWIRPWVLFDSKNEEGWIQGEIKAALR